MSNQVFIDRNIGVTMGSAALCVEKPNALGGTFWECTQPIGYLLGSPVEGECRGIGRTREQAMERLAEDVKRLGDSLWAE